MRLSKFLADLYRAASEPGGIAALTLPFARLFDSESGMILTQTDGAPVLNATVNFTPAHQKFYMDYYVTRDPWLNLTVEAGPGNAFIARDLVPDSDLLKSEIYADWLRPIDVFQCLGCAEKGKVGSVAIGIHRSRHARDFDESDKDRLRHLVLHYAQAVDIATRLDTARRSERVTVADLDNIDAGIAVVGVAGKILFANEVAEGHFRRGPALSAMGGFLSVADPGKAQTLAKAIRVAASIGTGGVQGAVTRIVLDGGGQAGRLILCVCPLPEGSLANGPGFPPCAMVLIEQPNRRALRSDRLLSRLYGLSSAEARLAAALVEGVELKEYAAMSEISYNTARTQLRSIFEKTGHARQSDLIRDVLSNPFMRLIGREDRG